jgi:hypothetical protein
MLSKIRMHKDKKLIIFIKNIYEELWIGCGIYVEYS